MFMFVCPNKFAWEAGYMSEMAIFYKRLPTTARNEPTLPRSGHENGGRNQVHHEAIHLRTVGCGEGGE